MEKVTRAVDAVKESLSNENGSDLDSSIGGLDVALLDMGRAIHTGSKRVQKPKKKETQSFRESGPIELGGSGRIDLDLDVEDSNGK